MLQRMLVCVVLLVAIGSFHAMLPHALGRGVDKAPQLRFLSWSHEDIRDIASEPVASDYWYPNGAAVAQPAELDPLRRFHGPSQNRSRSLHLFFSHPDFHHLYGRISLMTVEGQLIDPKMPRRTSAHVRRAGRRKGDDGWMYLRIYLPDDISVPDVGDIQLSYIIGKWEEVTRFSVDVEDDSLDEMGRVLDEGARLLAVGQRANRESFAIIWVDPHRGAKYQYKTRALLHNSKDIRPRGRSVYHEPAGVTIYRFREPLEEIKDLIILRSAVRTAEWKGVSLRPGMMTKPTYPMHDPSGEKAATREKQNLPPTGQNAIPSNAGVTRTTDGQPSSTNEAGVDNGTVIAEVKRLGGRVSIQEQESDRPAVEIDLNNTEITDADLIRVGAMVNLQALALRHTQITDVGLRHLEGMQQLKELDLWGTRVTDAGLVHLKGLTNLRKLYVGTNSGPMRVTDTGLENLAGLTRLRSLSLCQSRITDRGMVHLQGLKELRMLDLRSCDVGDAGLMRLKGLSQLQTVLLTNTRIYGAGMAFVEGSPGLTKLQLDGSFVGDTGLIHLSRLKHLVELGLANTTVTDSGLVHLKGLTQLRALDLTDNEVSDAGLKHFSELHELRALILVGTKVTDAGLAHLEGLRKLEHLLLVGTPVTDDGVRDLQEVLPNCEIKL